MIIETKIKKLLLLFDDEAHRFWFDKAGEKQYVNSVTGYTGVIDKSQVLIGWAVKLAKEYLLEKLERGEQIIAVDVTEAGKQHTIKKEAAADIGSKIHALAEQWIKTGKIQVSEEAAVINGFNAFMAYQAENKVKWLNSEMIVYSQKHHYAGITDAIGIINRELVLIDFKSSKYIYPEHLIQTAGYQLAYEEMTGKKIAYRLILRFGKEDGSFEVRVCADNDADKAAFLACVTLKNRLKELEKSWKDKI